MDIKKINPGDWLESHHPDYYYHVVKVGYKYVTINAWSKKELMYHSHHKSTAFWFTQKVKNPFLNRE